MLKKLIILGCLTGASFFLACNNEADIEASTTNSDSNQEFEGDMYEVSELAALMRQMYEDNLEIKKQIEEGNIPESFPQDFYTIHNAKATNPNDKNATFKALADQYLQNMEAITQAENSKQAKLAYNSMISTCASCHQIYCPGPLPKIKRMKIAVNE